ncbi:type II toxin-antitoxin system VapC family toxin [Cryobacterium sp. PH31-AA6]|uniref:type II toxin-antitoxin system VapC family toxin n=1 Tax=Cryobacterium sp. PH31-AA6 TaxID=3046205 RepID=UPI0024B94BA1|nr:type II toxin-antitoxin system VapC family toxin [Cryobacterium sp. PH31-AA6]MDJ0324881.1 type II toxin-antitoxin system VapC family toxin [Cryobacterium sp. PH31-AA6]
MTPSRGLLDTSVFIAQEQGRQLDVAALPDHQFVSAITHGELYAGVHAATSLHTRAVRLATIESLSGLVTLPADTAAAAQWGRMRQAVSESGRKVNVNDLWIAAIALAHSLPVFTQDTDFAVLADLGGPEIITV